MARPRPLGLRAQILASLFVAVVTAFGLLDVVAVRLGERARVGERMRSAEAAAELLAEVASSPWIDLARFDRLADSMIGRGGIRGIEVVRPGGDVLARGVPGDGRSVAARSEGGVLVRLYVGVDDSAAGRRQTEILFAYVALTAGGILVLVYGVLTLLVVRPVETLRRASERFAEGRLDRPVGARGPAELAALGASFDSMAAQLRADREALVARLAELEATTRGLREAQEQIVRTEKLASVGRLSAGVAHEIGNPLAAILGLVELLESGDLSAEESHEFVRRIRGETERIHLILRDLLDFARQGQDASADPAASCDPVEVAREAIALVKPQKAFRAITLELRADAGIGRVRGAEARLTQVLLNLLLNAADAIDGPGHVLVTIDARGGAVRIRVEDDGPGLDPALREKLFEPFVTTKPVGKGTGLGLAVCHTIVDRMGGTITAGGREGRGARFTIELPLTNQSADA